MMESSVNPASIMKDRDAFGCCSHYRECSDAKKCVIAGLEGHEYYVHCLYMKNLEEGNIFYGKNANWFSMEEYRKICDRKDALSPDAGAALETVLINFCEYNRGTRRMIARTDVGNAVADLGIFKVSPMGADFPRLCSATVLKKLVNSDSEYAALYASAKAARKARKDDTVSPGPLTKEFLEAWLNQEAAPFRDKLASPYCVIEIIEEMSHYMEELYQDFVISSYDSHIFPANPLDEDGLQTDSDSDAAEELRVKLSPGYSKEEKERRLSAIASAREARQNARKG